MQGAFWRPMMARATRPTRLTAEAGKSVQKGIDSLTKQLAAGNLQHGITTIDTEQSQAFETTKNP
jgi:hypothetical protein